MGDQGYNGFGPYKFGQAEPNWRGQSTTTYRHSFIRFLQPKLMNEGMWLSGTIAK